MALVNVIDSDLVSWQGRWSASKPVTCAWGASCVLFKTDAPKVVLKTGPGTKGTKVESARFGNLNLPCVIFWKVGKGEITKKIVDGAEEVVLHEALDDAGEKLVELVFGEIGGHLELDGLLISEGHTLTPVFPPSATPPLKLLFIGASQTTSFSSPEIHPPPSPFGAFTSWPLVFNRTLRNEGTDVRTTVVARPGIRMVEGTVNGEWAPGMDKRFWEGWEGAGAFGSSEGGQEAEKANVVFISIGSNDVATGVPAEDYISGLKDFMNALVTRVSPQARHVVFVTPFGFHSRKPGGEWSRTAIFEPQTKEMIGALSDEWEETGYAAKLWHCDTEGWIDGSRCPDGLHPDEQGNTDIAKRLREWCDVNLRDVF